MDEAEFNQLLSLVTQQNNQLVGLVTQQNKLLADLIGHLKGSQVGLRKKAPRPIYIYANRTKGTGWYTVEASEVKPIDETALTGYLTNVKFALKERRGKEVPKLSIFIKAEDQQYVIESGAGSQFSNSFLSAAVLLTPDQIASSMITIEPQAGKGETVLFCRVYCGGQYVKSSYDDHTDWEPIIQKVLSNLQTLNPDTVQVPAIATHQSAAQMAQPEPSEAGITSDYSDTIAKIGVQIDRLGWSKKTGSQHLQGAYQKKTRAELTEAQLLEFLGHLESLPTPEVKPVEPSLVAAGVRDEPWEH